MHNYFEAVIFIMKKELTIIIIFLFFLFSCSEEDVIKKWEKCFGGSEDDIGYSLIDTKDNKYVVVGMTESYGAGSSDLFIIKTDEDGRMLWKQTFGGTGADEGRSICSSNDEGYVVAGFTNSSGAGDFDIYIVKIDSYGNEEWSKTFGGAEEDKAFAISDTSDGGYIITGYTHSYGEGNRNMFLLKLNCLGDKEWFKTLGGNETDGGYAVCETSDGGYAVSGYIYSDDLPVATYSDACLVKAGSLGNQEWITIFGAYRGDIARSFCITSDDNFIITGSSGGPWDGSYDLMMAKIDSLGNLIFRDAIRKGTVDAGSSIKETKNGDFIITGVVSPGAVKSEDLYLILISPEREERWYRNFGNSKYDRGYDVIQTEDGGFLVTGEYTYPETGKTDLYLIKTDSNGKTK